MFRAPMFRHIKGEKLPLMLVSFLVILLTSGITFTFVIPGLKGFDGVFLAGAIMVYYVIANIFEEIFNDQRRMMFLLTFIFSSLGMAGRIWIEWGEFSLVEHMNILVMIGYPVGVSLILFFMTFVLTKL